MAEPTEDELADIKLAAAKMWELEQENILTPNEDYKINIKGTGKRMWDKADAGDEKLFVGVMGHVWQRPTFLTFYNLLDNYERETGVAEVVTHQERREMYSFLETMMDTDVMRYCHKFLAANGKAEEDEQAFKKQLYQAWFYPYRREGRGNDSSGFEHVFVGEERDGKIIGFHNWIQFYIEEYKGNVDYQGFILPRRRTGSEEDEPDGDERLISIQFAWDGDGDAETETKLVSSMLVGTSPEFEFALYTLCFFNEQDETELELGEYDLKIVCHRIRSKYGDKIASAYPEAM
eukprot:CAMPEP_0182905624 /NCGR_PEP_ID=MMETSP0034_2-20130328/33092_1 /TAXON_ID=156128 /ORGANISM="Nephroselmis pyriformis, Strain CCMP717" /LENGTH=290 /DNA_ID=CAMNT_0025041083 /DNA_START=25 /DNA_END=897 /DNA_ORIENTATION=+